MKKITKILSLLIVIATFVSLIPNTATAQFAESVTNYDDYGYYIYYDFENLGGKSNHSGYFKADASVNADGKLCDPFTLVSDNTATNGTGSFVADGDNHYYSFVTSGTNADASIMILGLTNQSPNDLIIGDAVEISFKFRMHQSLGSEQGIADTDKMSLIHLRRGGKGHATQVSVDKNGNIYARNSLVYTNTNQSEFLDISLKWYDATNTYSLYVNGNTVVEALNVRDTSGDLRTYTTTTFDDDFTVSSIVQNNTTDRAIEICRASNNSKKWGFDIDDIKVSRIETPQHGAYYYVNDFDIAANGLSAKNTAGNVHVYGGSGTSAFTASHGTENENGKTIGYLEASKNYFGIKDIYQLLSEDSFVTEFRIKGTATPSSGRTPLIQFITDGDVNDFTNLIKLFYVDANGRIFLESGASTVVNGFTLNENEWLDVSIVAVKNKTNAGKFGQITAQDTSPSDSNTTYTFSYFINGYYVGSTDPIEFTEWRKTSKNSYFRTASGDNYTVETFTVDGTEVTALDTSDTSVYTVVDSTTTANHTIYKSVIDGVTKYYDVETVDGVQTSYSIMTITDNSYEDSLRFSSSAFNIKFDYLKVYAGTCPAWFYESLYSDEGGDVWNIRLDRLGRTANNNKAMTANNGPQVSGTIYTAGFLNIAANQKINGSTLTLSHDAQFDFYLPVPDSSQFEVEYSFEVEFKNITDATAKNGEWRIALFNQRFENASGSNKPTGSLMFVGGGTTAGDTTLYGIGGNIALYNADGSVAKLDNTNGSRLRADLYINTSTGEHGVSYYLDGKPLYLADGSLAYRITNSTLNSRMNEFFGKVQNYRVRLIHATGSCTVDIPYINISINEKASYKEIAKTLDANSINAIEFTLPAVKTNSAGTLNNVVSLTKGTDSAISLLYAFASTGDLMVESNGKYYSLCDKNGNLLKLSSTESTPIAIVYDDINGDARYYVNKAPAYIKAGKEFQNSVDLAIADSAFTSASDEIKIQLLSGMPSGAISSVSDFATHKINDNDTAEIIGFQENSLTNGIRIVAGVDSLYYQNVGFEVDIYENGTLKKSEDTSNSIVFSSIIANDKDITSTEYGYSFFTTVNITDLPNNIPANSYILARSYTTVGGVKKYDTQIKITVTNNGYYIGDNAPDNSATVDIAVFDFDDCTTTSFSDNSGHVVSELENGSQAKLYPGNCTISIVEDSQSTGNKYMTIYKPQEKSSAPFMDAIVSVNNENILVIEADFKADSNWAATVRPFRLRSSGGSTVVETLYIRTDGKLYQTNDTSDKIGRASCRERVYACV